MLRAVNHINHNNPLKPIQQSETAADPGSDKFQVTAQRSLGIPCGYLNLKFLAYKFQLNSFIYVWHCRHFIH